MNVIERNGSNCKYVEIFTHYVGSTGAPSSLLEEQTPNCGKSLRLLGGTRRLTFFKKNKEVQNLRP
jgi:hypothetical protein